ncbi:MAG: DUF2628 domain-containing protein [Marinobacter sp.]|nr:DUF2628 domain-containing protein [Marinobacter sp.]
MNDTPSSDVSTLARSTLSKTWQQRFEIYDRYATRNGDALSDTHSDAYRQLTRQERRKVSFAILPFFAGAFYYLFKGMWHKGALLFGLALTLGALLIVIETGFEFEAPSTVLGIPLGILCALFAHYDYYKHVTYNEKVWPGLPALCHRTGFVIAAPFIGFALLYIAVVATEDAYPAPTETEYLINGVWVSAAADGQVLTVFLEELAGQGVVQYNTAPLASVEIASIHRTPERLEVSLQIPGGDQWTLRQDLQDQGERMRVSYNGGPAVGYRYLSGL